MLARILPGAIGVLISLCACAAPSSRITEYLAGIQPPPAETQPLASPLVAGLLVALPEAELAKPTAPSKEALERFAQRVQKELQASPKVQIQRIFPSVIIPGDGSGGLSMDGLREMGKDGAVTKMIVVVASSQTASKLRFFPVLETQLFARMDAALVDLSTGRVVLAEVGQEDYTLAETLYYSGSISYPRLYYRTWTVAGPFTVVDGDPHKALGEEAFKGAADQLGMRLRVRLSPEVSGG
jgi:hypothetical protein